MVYPFVPDNIENPGHALAAMKDLSNYYVGGASFRDWYSGLFKDGVYLYANNYNVKVMITSIKHITLIEGIQDSRCYGNARPEPASGCWINYKDVRDDIKDNVDKVIDELWIEVSKCLSIKTDIAEKERKKRIEEQKKKHELIGW